MKVVEKMEKKRKGENGGEEAIFIGRNYEARRKGASLVHGCWPLPSRIMKNLWPKYIRLLNWAACKIGSCIWPQGSWHRAFALKKGKFSNLGAKGIGLALFHPYWTLSHKRAGARVVGGHPYAQSKLWCLRVYTLRRLGPLGVRIIWKEFCTHVKQQG